MPREMVFKNQSYGLLYPEIMVLLFYLEKYCFVYTEKVVIMLCTHTDGISCPECSQWLTRYLPRVYNSLHVE